MICKKDDCFNCPYPDCINDYAPPLHVATEREKIQMRIRAHARYAERKAAEVCVACDRPARDGKIYCLECRNKRNRREREKYAERKWIEYG